MTVSIRRILIVVAAACSALQAAAFEDVPFSAAIERVQQRVVKLYGGQLGREKGYGSGVIVSSDGRIVTTLSVLLEGRSLRVVLADGRRCEARVIARDQGRQLALLQIDAFDLPYFELKGSAHVRSGDWVLAAANPFKVADGPEPVSVSVGVLSGRTTLTARRRAQDFPYDGPILLTDVIVATSGSAGGALVDTQGELIGLIGKPVISERTNTWLNYALPVEELAAFLAECDKPSASSPVAVAAATPSAGMTPAELGLRLFDVGSREPPPYVERVRADSLAWHVGLRPNDLILALDSRPIATCEEFQDALRALPRDRSVTLIVKRGEEVKQLELSR